jgi:hypothetical protein
LRSQWEGSTAVEGSWDESEKTPLEERLNEFVVGVVEKADYWREWHRRRDEEERRRLDEQRRRWEEEQRRQREAAQLKELEDEAGAWARSRRIRDYIHAVRLAADGVSISEELSAWLEWAEGRAALLDPIPDRLGVAGENEIDLGTFEGTEDD